MVGPMDLEGTSGRADHYRFNRSVLRTVEGLFYLYHKRKRLERLVTPQQVRWQILSIKCEKIV